jgi:hypothetical protein
MATAFRDSSPPGDELGQTPKNAKGGGELDEGDVWAWTLDVTA